MVEATARPGGPRAPAWQGVVGRTGTAWGAGLHGTGAPTGRDGPRKREGDGKSPAGVFALRGSYGYAAAPPAGTRLPYTPLDGELEVRRRSGVAPLQPDPRSSARRASTGAAPRTCAATDDLYTWVVDIAHNPARTGGEGSCIFLHVWSGPSSTTVGCTAMDAARLAALIAELDPTAAPTLVLLPRAEYDALAITWALPRP